MSNKYVYLFTEGNANMRELLGGKGANLAEMTNLACRCRRASRSLLRPAPAITRMARLSLRRSWSR